MRILVLLAVLCTGTRAASRVYFSSCTKNGFTCSTNPNKKTDLTYQCPPGIDNIIIFINQFSAPSSIENLKIQNCNSLTLSTRCSGDRRPIQKLEVLNVNRLSFQRAQFDPMVPPTVIFQNISHIDVIPTKTFGQIVTSYYSSGCYVQPSDFQNIYFRNVTVDTIQSGAFVGLKEFRNFSFVNVNIKRIQTSAIQLNHHLQGGFEMRNGTVQVVEELGVQLYGKRAIFNNNHFTEISSGGINGSLEDFYFTENFLETLQPHGFSILATNVYILDNNFLHLKSSALEKVSPGLLQDSGRNFGKLKFVYDFSKNALNFLDFGSLHPDYVSYENVPTEMTFSRNAFLCSCQTLSWLISGPNTAQGFYEMVLDESYDNVCSKSEGKPCEMPLKMLKKSMGCGQCLKNVTLEMLCDRWNNVEEIAEEVMSLNVTQEMAMLSPSNYTVGGASCVRSASYLVLMIMIMQYL